jgi:hypothetical protein
MEQEQAQFRVTMAPETVTTTHISPLHTQSSEITLLTISSERAIGNWAEFQRAKALSLWCQQKFRKTHLSILYQQDELHAQSARLDCPQVRQFRLLQLMLHLPFGSGWNCSNSSGLHRGRSGGDL